MPHDRKRYASTLIQKALTHSPIVGVLGQRQVGKTTLVSSLAKEYATLDVSRELELATHNPSAFIENRSIPFGIDEAQLCPPLFPALKEWVRIHPKKGQIILTGSVRFTSRKVIRESLTGRIVNIEILPFTYSELCDKSITCILNDLWKLDSPVKLEKFGEVLSKKRSSSFDSYLEKGGLPGICFFREANVRRDRFDAHLETLLLRDLQLVIQTTTTGTQLKNLVRFLAERQGTPFSLKDASEYSNISTITVKKLLNALEALYLIRALPTEGTVSKSAYVFEDQGMASFCAKSPFSKTSDIFRGVYANLRQEVLYEQGAGGDIFSFKTHDGAWVPLVFRSLTRIIGVIPLDDDQITRKAIESGKSFMFHFPNAKIIYAYTGKIAHTKDFKAFAIPYWWLI
jgi:predicted AAA+ superfamily ATPase